MANLKNEKEYSCFDDCKQSGCPGHKMKLTIQTCSECLMVYRDDEFWFGADPSEWKTLKLLLQELDYGQFDLEKEIQKN